MAVEEDKLPEKLAQSLNIEFYDHEIIEMAASSSDIDKELFDHGDNEGYGSLQYDLSSGVQNFSLNDKIFLHQANVIRNLVKKGPCVIVGRCADFVLKGRKNVIKVFIYADLDERNSV